MSESELIAEFFARGGEVTVIPTGRRTMTENEIRDLCSDRGLERTRRAEKRERDAERRAERYAV